MWARSYFLKQFYQFMRIKRNRVPADPQSEPALFKGQSSLAVSSLYLSHFPKRISIFVFTFEILCNEVFFLLFSQRNVSEGWC